MSKKSQLLSAFYLSLICLTATPAAMAGESVQGWVGVVDDLNGSHDPSESGDHQLKFTRASDGESFFISSGDEGIQKEHLRVDKSIEVKIDGRITSKFLFFGGNLVVSNFEKLADLEPIRHKQVARMRDLGPSGRRGR